MATNVESGEKIVGNGANHGIEMIQIQDHQLDNMESVSLNDEDAKEERTPLKEDLTISAEPDEVPKCDEFERLSNIPESIFNLVNSIVGGGIIGLAYSFTNSGMPMGIIMLILSGIVTDYAILLLIKCGIMADRYTYQGVAEAAFGKPGLIIITIAQFVFPLSVMMAYGVAISDNIPIVFSRTVGQGTILTNRQFINGMATLLIIVPLSLPRNIAILDKFSALSIFCVLFYSVVIVVRSAMVAPLTYPSPGSWDFAKPRIPQAIGVMAFAVACLHNVFPMYRVLKRTSVKRYRTVVHSSVLISIAFYIAVAVSGYVTFTGVTKGNLLNNFCPDDDVANAARFVFALTIILTFPIQVFTSREVIEVGFFRHYKRSAMRHVIITLLLIGMATAVSMSTDCLGLVLELAGCFSASPLAFIFPPLMYMKLRGEGMFKLRYVLLWALTIFGFAVMILGTVMAILTHSGSCTFKEAERYWCQSDHDGIIGNKTSNYTTVFSSTPLPMTNIPPTSFLSTITANMTN